MGHAIAIIGSPRAGKTTLAQRMAAELEIPIVHADDLIDLGWSEASDALAAMLQSHNAAIYEGVAVVRALRKVLRVDARFELARCYVLPKPRLPLTAGQERMRIGCETVLREILPELERRHIPIERVT